MSADLRTADVSMVMVGALGLRLGAGEGDGVPSCGREGCILQQSYAAQAGM